MRFDYYLDHTFSDDFVRVDDMNITVKAIINKIVKESLTREQLNAHSPNKLSKIVDVLAVTCYDHIQSELQLFREKLGDIPNTDD